VAQDVTANCRDCGTLFERNPRKRGGRCDGCFRRNTTTRKALWRIKNPDKYREQQRAWRRSWKERNPGAVLPAERKSWWWRRYGLTPDDFARMLGSQGGVCCACAGAFTEKKEPCVDHVHVVGWSDLPPLERRKYVRGLLCRACNCALGHAKDDRRRLAGLYAYLERFQALSGDQPLNVSGVNENAAPQPLASHGAVLD
jgi:hypothetical protein